MKNKGAIIALFLFTTIALGAFLLKDKIKEWFKPKAADPGTGNTNTGTNTVTTETIIKYVKDPIDDVPNITDLDKDLILKKGSKNDEVKKLQSMINQVLKIKKKTQLVADGAFGAKTETALYYLIKKKQTTLSQFATIMVTTLGKGV